MTRVSFNPTRFTLYLSASGLVSTQSLTRTGGLTYSVSAASAQGSPMPPGGRPFTCSVPVVAAMTATLGFEFGGLSTAEADAWRAAFKAGRTVYVSMDIGPGGANGREWLTVDLRVATVQAALGSAATAVAEGFSDAMAFVQSVATAVQFALMGVVRLFKKAPTETPALASAGVAKRVD